jgi:hypothetical protein
VTSFTDLVPYMIPVIMAFAHGTGPTIGVVEPKLTGDIEEWRGAAEPTFTSVAELDAEGTVSSSSSRISSIATAAWLETSIGQLGTYLDKVDGWKGEGSAAPTERIIADARDLWVRLPLKCLIWMNP